MKHTGEKVKAFLYKRHCEPLRVRRPKKKTCTRKKSVADKTPKHPEPQEQSKKRSKTGASLSFYHTSNGESTLRLLVYDPRLL